MMCYNLFKGKTKEEVKLRSKDEIDVTIKKTITMEEIHKLAEGSVKVTRTSNGGQLATVLRRKALAINDVIDLSKEIRESMAKSAIELEVDAPLNETETRTKCINSLVEAIKSVTGIKCREEHRGRSNSSVTDYYFENTVNGLTNKLVIEAKNYNRDLFNKKDNVDLTLVRQCVQYANSNCNGEAFSVVILTNGANILVFIKGVVKCKNGKNWQPLRDESKPVLKFPCFNISVEDSNVLAYIIYQTLNGNHNIILERVSEVYDTAVNFWLDTANKKGYEVV